MTPPAPPNYGFDGHNGYKIIPSKLHSKKMKRGGRENPDQGQLFEKRTWYFTTTEAAEFASVWNGAITLPKITHMKGRMAQLHEFMSDPWYRENYREGIKKIASSRFCRGHNSQGWKASVDWFLRVETLPKIMEGKYDDRNAPKVKDIAEYKDETL